MANAYWRLRAALLLAALLGTALNVADARDVPCTSANITGVWNDGRTEWTLDDDVLRQYDLQDAVDCAEDGDAILLRASRMIRPEARVTLHQSVTVEGKGSAPSALTCPEGEGIFLIKGGIVTLRTMRIEECHIEMHLGVIEMDVGNCSGESDNILRLENMELRNIDNVHASGSAGIYVSHPSCSEVIMEDVTLRRVKCFGSRMAVRNTIRRLILIDNEVLNGYESAPALFSFPPNSMTNFTDSTVSRTSGSVLSVVDGNLEIVSSSFTDNSHRNQNGTINAANSSLTISGSMFESNKYHTGGCIYAVASNMWIVNSTFKSNRCSSHNAGGCIYAIRSQMMEIAFSRFLNNKAKDGGAIAVYKANIRMKLEDVQFEKNIAKEGTACLKITECEGIKVSVVNSRFLDNQSEYPRFGWGPGAISIVESTGRLHAQSNRFEANTGKTSLLLTPREEPVVGYALVLRDVIGRLMVSIDSSIFDSSSKDGSGAIGVYHCGGSTLTVNNCTVRNLYLSNDGAAIFVYSIKNFKMIRSELTGSKKASAVWANEASSMKIRNCNFTNNSAEYGAAIRLSSSTATIYGCRFEGNVATEKGGAISSVTADSSLSMEHSTFKGNKARIGGGLYFVPCLTFTIISVEMTYNEATLYGGGIAAHMSFNSKDYFIQIYFKDATFKHNKASLGGDTPITGLFCSHFETGAIHFAVTKTFRSAVLFLNPSFEDNYAEKAGGALYTDIWSIMAIPCAQPKFKTTKDHLCASMKRNTVGPEGYGKHVATSSTAFFVRLHFENGSTVDVNQSFSLHGWKSGDAFPTAEVITLDYFGHERSLTNLPNYGSIDFAKGELPGYEEYVRAMMSSKDHFINNTLTTDMSEGSNNLTVGRPFTRPGEFSVTISVKDITDESVNINISVKECTINEKTTLNGTFCQECDGDHYNFKPENTSCILCPDNADCSCNFIIPEKGYWNVLPCSPHIDRCVFGLACSKNRTKVDVRFAEEACINHGRSATKFDETNSISSRDFEELSKKYSQSLCIDGHEGPLCGSCTKNWAQSGGPVCRECRPPAVAGSAVGGEFIIVMLTVMLEISATRKSSRLSYKGLTRSKRIVPRSHRSVKKVARLVDGMATQKKEEMEVAELKFQEVIKVPTCLRIVHHHFVPRQLTVNFLQMIALGRKLGVSWARPIGHLFKSWDFIGSANNMLGSYGWDCLLPYDGPVPRAVLREIFIFLTPLGVLIIISIYWLTTSRNANVRKTRRRLCLLTAIILMNNSYISLAESALNVFYSVQVHINMGGSTAMQEYWAIDTSVLWKSRSHWILVGIVGIPGLVFSVVFPICVIASLVNLRKEEKLDSDWAQETLGIFIGGYKDSYVYWDAIILVRKAMLSAVLAFSYNLGGNLQGNMAIGIVGLFLVIHMKLNPYKDELHHLNNLESCSLSVIAFTLLTGVILDDERMQPKGIQWTLISVVVTINICMFAYLVVDMVRLKVRVMKFELDAEEVDCGDGRFLEVVITWMGYYLKTFCRGRNGCERVYSFESDPEDVQISDDGRDESQSPVDILGEIQTVDDDHRP